MKTQKSQKSHKYADNTGLVLFAYKDWKTHIAKCPDCQELIDTAMKIAGDERDIAYWILGFQVCLDLIQTGRIKMAYLNPTGGNN